MGPLTGRIDTMRGPSRRNLPLGERVVIVAALVIMVLTWWVHRVLFGRMRSPAKTMSFATMTERTGDTVPPLGLEDDPGRWNAERHTWNALDEHQLSRLLRESASIENARTTTDLDTPNRN